MVCDTYRFTTLKRFCLGSNLVLTAGHQSGRSLVLRAGHMRGCPHVRRRNPVMDVGPSCCELGKQVILALFLIYLKVGSHNRLRDRIISCNQFPITIRQLQSMPFGLVGNSFTHFLNHVLLKIMFRVRFY